MPFNIPHEVAWRGFSLLSWGEPAPLAQGSKWMTSLVTTRVLIRKWMRGAGSETASFPATYIVLCGCCNRKWESRVGTKRARVCLEGLEELASGESPPSHAISARALGEPSLSWTCSRTSMHDVSREGGRQRRKPRDSRASCPCVEAAHSISLRFEPSLSKH